MGVGNNQQSEGKIHDNRINEIVALLGERMSADPSSHVASHVPGFMAIRLMMLKTSQTDEEKELIRVLVGSYSSYTSAGRTRDEVAILLARDFLFLANGQY